MVKPEKPLPYRLSSIERAIVPAIPSIGLPSIGRYATEFKMLDFLGKGGFGWVFKARHVIDGVDYAVKSILLTDHPGSIEKILREVKCLAKLESEHCVRYYNSWVEPYDGTEEAWVQERKSWFDVLRTNCMAKAGDFGASGVSETDTGMKSQSWDVAFGTTTGGDVSDSEEGEISVINTEDSNKGDSSKPYSKSYWEETTEEGEDSVVVFEMEEQNNQQALVVRPAPIHRRRCIGTLYIQMQLCDKMTLGEWLRQPGRLIDHNASLDVLRQIVRGLHHVHSCGVIHRDIKPSNIFMHRGQVKLGDFGLSTQSGIELDQDFEVMSRVGRNAKHTKGLGTPTYASPEQIAGREYDEKTDIFSLGMVLFEMFNPTSTAMERHMLFTQARLSNFPEQFEHRFPAEAKLCQRMLLEAPAERPTAWEIVQVVIKLGSAVNGERRVQEQSVMLASMQSTISLQRDVLLKDTVLGEPAVNFCEPTPETSMLFTGRWTPARHTECFWGFRAKSLATTVALFSSCHATQCAQIVREMGEYRTWSVKKQKVTQTELYQMLAKALWEKSLSWMFGPSADPAPQ